MTEDYAVAVAAGSLRGAVRADAELPHRWTAEGVAVQVAFTGAHLLHLSVAGCVLNDLYREAAALGVPLDGVRVDAQGTFEPDTWRSEDVTYRVEVASAAADSDVQRLLARVDDVAEVPRALRAGAQVRRVER